MSSGPNYTKKEVALAINAFNKPLECTGKEAWIKLFLQLLFLRKGTYPSMPDMGIGIQDYEYEYIENAIESLTNEIKSQCTQYLPDLPLSSVKIVPNMIDGKEVLTIGVAFDDNGTITTGAVAALMSNKIIDFEVVW